MITTDVFDLDDTIYNEIEYCKSGFTGVIEFLANLLEASSTDYIFTTFWKKFTAGE